MEENLLMDSMEKAAQGLFVLGETCSQMSVHTNAIWEAKSVLKSMELDGAPQQMLKDMADMLVRLAIIFEKSWCFGGILMAGLMLPPALRKRRRRI